MTIKGSFLQVSEEIRGKLTFSDHQSGVMALLTFYSELDERQVKKVSSVLGDVFNNVAAIIYHASNHLILHIEAKCYMLLGEKLLEGNGYKIERMVLTHLEGNYSLNALIDC